MPCVSKKRLLLRDGDLRRPQDHRRWFVLIHGDSGRPARVAVNSRPPYVGGYLLLEGHFRGSRRRSQDWSRARYEAARSKRTATNRVRSLLTVFSGGVKAAMAWCPSLVTQSSPVDRRMDELHLAPGEWKIGQDTSA